MLLYLHLIMSCNDVEKNVKGGHTLKTENMLICSVVQLSNLFQGKVLTSSLPENFPCSTASI